MRLSPARFLGLFGALVAAMAIIMTLSIRATARLGDEAAQAGVQAHALRVLHEERATLAAQQPHADARERLERDQAAVTVARAALQEQREEFQRASLAAMRRAKAAPETPREPSIRTTPEATIQSAIRAVIDGEAGELTGLIDFDAAARVEAESFFASLPPDLREQYGSPDQLVAHVMAAKTASALAAVADQPTYHGPDDASVRMNLKFPYGISRSPTFQMHRAADGWRLRVPARVIEGYRTLVTGVVFTDTVPAPAR